MCKPQCNPIWRRSSKKDFLHNPLWENKQTMICYTNESTFACFQLWGKRLILKYLFPAAHLSYTYTSKFATFISVRDIKRAPFCETHTMSICVYIHLECSSGFHVIGPAQSGLSQWSWCNLRGARLFHSNCRALCWYKKRHNYYLRWEGSNCLLGAISWAAFSALRTRTTLIMLIWHWIIVKFA
jgi:hypothetical protein